MSTAAAVGASAPSPGSGSRAPLAAEAIRAIPRFSAQLESAVQSAVPDKVNDPLYKPDFDPIDFLNEAFPSEESLCELPAFLTDLRATAASLDAAARAAAHAGAEAEGSDDVAAARTALSTASSSITSLSRQIKDIKAHALRSEAVVHEVCRDITALDHAKRNIKATISGLRNLHMLTTAASLLRSRADVRDFAESARLLRAISDLLRLFEPYATVPKVRELRTEVSAVSDQLRVAALSDLRSSLLSGPAPSAAAAARIAAAGTGTGAAGTGSGVDADGNQTADADAFLSSSALPSSAGVDVDDDVTGGLATVAPHLRNACLILDALPFTHKKAFLTSFYARQFASYETIFGPGGEGWSIAATARRYSWLRRELKSFEARYKLVFPDSWTPGLRFVQAFCAVTRRHLLGLLLASPHAVFVPADVSAEAAAAAAGEATGSSGHAHGGSSSAAVAAGSVGRDGSVTMSAVDFGLSAGRGPSAAEVAVLTGALLKTFEFEKEMATKFKQLAAAPSGASDAPSCSQPGSPTVSVSTNTSVSAAVGVASPLTSASVNGDGVGLRSPSSTTTSISTTSVPATAATTSASAAASFAAPPVEPELSPGSLGSSLVSIPAFPSSVSSAFSPFLGGLVTAERHHLTELLSRLAAEEQWAGPPAGDEGGDPAVDGRGLRPRMRYASADELLLYFKKSSTHCARVSTGAPLLGVCDEIVRALGQYAGMLESRARRRPGQVLTPTERLMACLVTTTADYLAETLPALADSLKSKLDAPSAALAAGPDGFLTTSAALGERLSSLASRATAAIAESCVLHASGELSSLARVAWAVTEVGDQSPAVTRAIKAIVDAIALPATLLPLRFHGPLVSQTTSGVATRVRQAIFSLRGISTAGAQQLAVDVAAILAALSDLPSVYLDPARGVPATRPPPSRVAARVHARAVAKEMGALAAVAKALQAPPAALAFRFRALFPGAGSEDLKTITRLLGLKKTDAAQCLKDFAAEEANAQADAQADPAGAASAAAAAAGVGGAAGNAANSSVFKAAATDSAMVGAGAGSVGADSATVGTGSGTGDANASFASLLGGGGSKPKDDSKRGAISRFVSRVMN